MEKLPGAVMSLAIGSMSHPVMHKMPFYPKLARLNRVVCVPTVLLVNGQTDSATGGCA